MKNAPLAGIPMVKQFATTGISVNHTDIFRSGRSEIKPSEIPPKVYAAFHQKWAGRSDVI